MECFSSQRRVSSSRTIDPDDFAGKSHNTPYGGMELTGRVLATIKAGRFTYRDSRI